MPKDIAASNRAKLLQVAHTRGEDFQLVLSDFATERLLHRLSVSAHSRSFVLKGAMLMRVWSAERYRATWDLDLLGLGLPSVEAIIDSLRQICGIQVDDGLTFDVESVVTEPILQGTDDIGVRFGIICELAGARIPMQIDVAVGDTVVPAPRIEGYPTLLDHAPPRVLVYAKETVVAEKLEAILTGGPTNSRVKDFYDLRVLAANFDFEGASLVTSIRSTFEKRGTGMPSPEPREITDAYLSAPERRALWRSFWRRSRPSELPESVETLGESLRGFLGPVCRALSTSTDFSSRWAAGGPWR